MSLLKSLGLLFSSATLALTTISASYGGQLTKEISSRGKKTEVRNNEDQPLRVSYRIYGSIGMSRDNRGPVDPNGYMQNGRAFSSGGVQPVVYMRMQCSKYTNGWKEEYYRPETGGSGSQIQSFGRTGYCSKPIGKQGTFTIPAGETIYFWVQDSHYKDNSGAFEIVFEY